MKIHGDEILNHANWEISVGYTSETSSHPAEILRTLRKNGSDVTSEPGFCVCKDPKVDDKTFYSLLVDTQTVEVVNRWRRERGDPELRVADFAKSTEHAS